MPFFHTSVTSCALSELLSLFSHYPSLKWNKTYLNAVDRPATRRIEMPITWGQSTNPCHSCSSDSACDSSIHAANKLATRHDRVSICHVCQQAPAVVTCKADAASLCSACDHHIHTANPLAYRHQRIPFFQTPSDLASAPKSSPSSFQLVPTDVLHHSSSSEPTLHHSWLIHNHQKKIDAADFLFSPDFDPFLDSGSTDFDIKQQLMDEFCDHRSYGPSAIADSVVPIQPMNTHPDDFSNKSCFVIDFTKSKLSRFHFPAQRISQSVSSSDVGIVPDGNTNSISEVSNFSFSNSTSTKGSSLDGGSTAQLSPNDRKARVLRYREKRKNRRFEKTIRYASRKAYAEIRPRIKGRFAKRTHIDADADEEVSMIYGSAPHCGIAGNFILDDDMYGVVPSL